MKKVKLLIKSAALFVIIMAATACKEDDILNICTTCTESTTSVSETFCGNLVQVEAYETTLMNSGSGSWSCVRN